MTKDVMEKTYKIDISYKPIIFTILLIILLNFVWLIRELVFSLFIAFIIMSALKPSVYYLERKKIPKILSTFIIFIFIIFLAFYFFSSVIPLFVVETIALFRNLPAIIVKINPTINQYINLDFFSQYLPNLTSNLFSLIGNILSNVFFVFSTLFFSFYFILEEGFIKKFVFKFFKENEAHKIVEVFEKVEKRMSAWFWGELTLMLAVGALTFIGLSILGIRYALPLAVIAGLLEVIPNLGPTISAIPSFIIAFSQSYFLGFSVIALYLIVQQLENNLIVPLIMRRVVGINPIMTLIALVIGGKVAGLFGIILAIPVTLFLEVLVTEYLNFANRPR